MKRFILKNILIALAMSGSASLLAQGAPRLTGSVKSAVTGAPVDFGMVIIFEAQRRGMIGSDGTYDIALPNNGSFTVEIRVDGLKPSRQTVDVRGITVHNVTLQPMSIAGAGVTIRGDRKQDLSRRSMTVEELNAVPATLGDSVSALTSLPGVTRYSGGGGGGSNMYGQMTVRGMEPNSNRFFVDGVPIQYPQHFFGLHAVVANPLISTIDLYSSAHPAEFNGAMGSVIQINTLDKVEEFGGVVEMNLLSGTSAIWTPTYSNTYQNGQLKKERNGYFIVAGRVGYLSLFVPIIYELIQGEELDQVPNYWDYQIKYKHYFNSRNSLTLMAMGAKDWWDVRLSSNFMDDTMDPLIHGAELDTDQMFNNQMAVHKYTTGKVTNRLTGYSALPTYINNFGLNHDLVADAFRDIKMRTMPYEFGIKDELFFDYMEGMGQLAVSAGYTHYRFSQEGDVVLMRELPESGEIDYLKEDSLFYRTEVDKTYTNNLFHGHLSNSLTFGGLTVIPQVRLEYLDRAESFVADPRGLVKYEFPSRTTVSVASGLYHEFVQVNPYMFNMNTEFANMGKEVKPERSLQNVLGVKQELGLYTLSVEGFYNYYYDMLRDWPHEVDGKLVPVKNTGEKKTIGAEIMLKKDALANVNDYFGWISYTFTQSEERDNVPISVDKTGKGEIWYTSPYEQKHAIKLMTGYKMGNHLFSAQFQFYTSHPYTRIIGSVEDEEYKEYMAEKGEDKERHVPVYSDEPYTEHNTPEFQLDIRYTYNAKYKWGNVKWYIEVVDVLSMFNDTYTYTYYYNKPYSKSNPKDLKDEGIGTIPNMGVEISF
ncbi:MAG: TonB-dependent receptor [Spirochaetes bacterium]|nr:TonB-dependent receptor [Spirochaetota bacterium]MBN2770087.1 TonB-dependent receptor [Spirochaetota bacterium]